MENCMNKFSTRFFSDLAGDSPFRKSRVFGRLFPRRLHQLRQRPQRSQSLRSRRRLLPTSPKSVSSTRSRSWKLGVRLLWARPAGSCHRNLQVILRVKKSSSCFSCHSVFILFNEGWFNLLFTRYHAFFKGKCNHMHPEYLDSFPPPAFATARAHVFLLSLSSARLKYGMRVAIRNALCVVRKRVYCNADSWKISRFATSKFFSSILRFHWNLWTVFESWVLEVFFQ